METASGACGGSPLPHFPSVLAHVPPPAASASPGAVTLETLELFSPTRWGPCRELSQPPGPAGSQEVGCKQPQGPLCSFLFLFGPAGSRWAAGLTRQQERTPGVQELTRQHPRPRWPCAPRTEADSAQNPHTLFLAAQSAKLNREGPGKPLGPSGALLGGQRCPRRHAYSWAKSTDESHCVTALPNRPHTAHPFVCVVQTQRHRAGGTAGGSRDIRQEGGGPGNSGHMPSHGETLCSKHAHN